MRESEVQLREQLGIEKREVPPQLASHAFKPGPDPRRTGVSAVVKEVRELAKAAAPDAVRKLIHLVANGSAAVQVQAAKAVLGIAGVPLSPSLNVKHQHEVSGAPVGVNIRDLIALVRASSTQMPVPGAMPRLAAGPVTLEPPPDGSVGARSRPLTDPSGPIEADYREITEDSSRPASYDAQPPSCTSGSQPEVLEGQVGEKTEDSSRG